MSLEKIKQILKMLKMAKMKEKYTHNSLKKKKFAVDSLNKGLDMTHYLSFISLIE